jgi:nicotinamide-nucleotide adenylyltransferase
MPAKLLDFSNIVKQFITNNEKFKLIYQSRPLILPMTTRLLILDSSFNPPHKGHLSMVQKSIVDLQKAETGTTTINNNSVLLLFSLKNADKKDAISLENYIHRLNMIQLLSQYIDENLGVACGIAITNASLFVEKSDILKEWVNEHDEAVNSIDQYFLLGFDTVIRFFDMKYYSPQYSDISEAVGQFFEKSKICMFLREDPSSKMGIEQQKEYVSTQLPASLTKEDIVVTASEKEWNISSSGIRKEIDSGNSEWQKQVIPSVAQYILDKRLYLSH